MEINKFTELSRKNGFWVNIDCIWNPFFTCVVLENALKAKVVYSLSHYRTDWGEADCEEGINDTESDKTFVEQIEILLEIIAKERNWI